MNYADRVKDTTTTTGTGPITVAGAPPAGYQGLAAIGPTGTTFIYGVVGTSEWEIGIGTITGAATFSRAPQSSSNGGALVNFSAGAKDFICTLGASSAKAGLVDPDDVGFDICLGFGQSNMVGYGGTVDTAVDCADSRVFQFGGYPSDSATYQKIVLGVDPLKIVGGDGALSMSTAFAKAYAASIPANRKVLLVIVASGGTSIVVSPARWASGNPGNDLYELAISQANAAIAAALLIYPKSRFVLSYMALGETDGTNSVTGSAYTTALKALIAGFRSRITGATNSAFIVSGMVPEAIAANANFVPIDAAQKQVCLDTTHAWFVAGPSGYSGDALHYNAIGARIFGPRIAAVVRSAQAYLAAPVPATALTLSLSSASSVIGTPITVTVGTDQPLTGSQSQSVTLTAPVAGTWSVNPVTLNASTATAAPTFTPSASGTGNIGATSTGTPTLSGTTAGYTALPAATVPATMSAPVATAGDTTASIAFTAPSDGGSAITSYVITPYIGGTAQTPQSTTTLTSPYVATSLTNGTAYTFKIHAVNAIGAGTDSPASNSVTPAPAVAYLRLTATRSLTESGTGPYGYLADSNDYGSGTGGVGVLSKKFANGVDGQFQITLQAMPNNGPMLGTLPGTTLADYTGLAVGIWASNSGGYKLNKLGSISAANGTPMGPIAGDIIRMTRTGSTLVFDVARVGTPTTFVTVHTETGVATTGSSIGVCSVLACSINGLAGSGLV